MPDFGSVPQAADSLEELEDTERMLKSMNQIRTNKTGAHSLYPKTIAETDLFVRYKQQ